MLCQICNAVEASIHIQEFVNGESKTLHLCVNCARKRMVNAASGVKLPPVNEIMKALAKRMADGKEAPVIGMFDLKTSPEDKKDSIADLSCGVCGYHLQQYKKTGLLHCESCYEKFADELNMELVMPNRNAFHIGRKPCGVVSTETDMLTKRIQKEKELKSLRRKLREMVIREEYEAAAQIKNEILQFEQTLKSQFSQGNNNHSMKE